jgi:hypothetical protein
MRELGVIKSVSKGELIKKAAGLTPQPFFVLAFRKYQLISRFGHQFYF